MPRSAEALCGRVGAFRAGDGPQAPTLGEGVLQAFRACGRVCALALAGGHVLGLPLARYFLRVAVAQDFACSLEELQRELLAEEDPHEPSAALQQTGACFLERTLSEQGLDGVMVLARPVSDQGREQRASRGSLVVALAPPEAEGVEPPDVTNENKEACVAAPVKTRPAPSPSRAPRACSARFRGRAPPVAKRPVSITVGVEVHCNAGAAPPECRGWARSLVSVRLRGLMSVPRGRYARAYLEHKLVTCIAQQADAFGQGVRDVLPLLGSRDLDELKAAWARHAKL